MDNDTLLEDLMRAADPHPGPGQAGLTPRHIAVRDQIMASSSTQRHLPSSRWRKARKALTPTTVLAAMGAVLAFAAGAYALQAPPVGEPSDRPASSEEWAEEFSTARAQATSEFERQVLADDWIEPAEYDSAVQMYVECAAAAGVTIRVRGSILDETRNYEVTSAPGQSRLDALLSDCGEGTINVIEGLYDTLLHSGERARAMAACLVAVGAVPPPYSADDYSRDAETEPFLRWMVDDEDASRCRDNPRYAG